MHRPAHPEASGIGIKLLLLISVLSFVATSCSGVMVPTAITPVATPEAAITTTPQPIYSEVTFQVLLAQPLPDEGKIFLNILDEVTGLALNPERVEVPYDEESSSYVIVLPFKTGSVVKYRYTRESTTSAVEYTPLGNQVRYRLVRVDGTSLVSDTISGWNDQHYLGDTGRIIGSITSDQGSVAPGLMVTAGGVRTFTSSDGSFVLEGLPSGTHNLFVYALDGAFNTFQQGALVEAGKTTPAAITLTPATMVDITFRVSIPVENVVGLPVRLAGNLYQTGNTFSDLAGGLSVISSRMPLMNQDANGEYSLTLSLPIGADFRYKYSLGDGFWNAELNSDGGFTVRQLIVSSENTTIHDQVATWGSISSGAITFNVQAPGNTPPGDFVSIQFNPYGWTEPIPMWAMGNNQWLYILYSPLNLISQMGYRFCRNGQCGSADEINFSGNETTGRPVTISKDPQVFQDTIEGWQWWQPSASPTTVIAENIQPRGPEFITGFEFTSLYHPSMQLRFSPSYQTIQQIGANWVTLDPSWTISSANPLVFEPLPGQDLLWSDLLSIIQEANTQGLHSTIFPTLHFNKDADEWWQEAKRDSAWWDAWFERYQTFITYHADAATAGNASALILGGDLIYPALPDGKLSDGTSSGVPEDAIDRWSNIIAAAHQHYSGKIYWAASFERGLNTASELITQTDGLYLLWSAPLTNELDPEENSLVEKMGTLLDEEVQPFHELNGGKCILAVSYASANGAASGCIPGEENKCISPARLDRPYADIPVVNVDLQEQVDLYNAIFTAVNQRNWIDGIVSRNFYYPTALQDKSASVNGKPALDVIWYWFPGLSAQ